MTLVIGARCIDGVVITTDLKLTSRATGQIKYLRLEPKIFGVFMNVIFGYTGDVDVNDVFVKYSLGDSIVKRDDPDNVYTISNFIQKLSDNMTKIRTILSRNNRSFLLRLMVARQFPHNGKSDLYALDSNGEHHQISDWEVIGDSETCAKELIKQRWQHEMTMSGFAKLSYSIIRYIEEKHISEAIGLEGNKPPTKYLKDAEKLDTDLTEQQWNDFQQSYETYERCFDNHRPPACYEYI